ncbi:hypothetical protein ES332_A10G221300v1 [Gossypium tomentosum]|uniref:Uncharacterized protein n=1 Tax=Gossypium tomentosum TaxID=34277 RepID=A0A5D2NT82_GOSTO|nr:hypothetical protein ES332_A10G221300v1 [Gossypium tomentosum]
MAVVPLLSLKHNYRTSGNGSSKTSKASSFPKDLVHRGVFGLCLPPFILAAWFKLCWGLYCPYHKVRYQLLLLCNI